MSMVTVTQQAVVVQCDLCKGNETGVRTSTEWGHSTPFHSKHMFNRASSPSVLGFDQHVCAGCINNLLTDAFSLKDIKTSGGPSGEHDNPVIS